MTSSIETEVRSISKRRQTAGSRRTDRAIGNVHEKLGEDRTRIVPGICSRTDKQTDTLIVILRHTYTGGGVIV